MQAQRCSLHAQEDQDSPDSDPNDFFDRQVTKDIPPHLTGEWRSLAESIRASILTRNPDVRWDAIVGLPSAKQLLQEAVVQPVKYPDLFTGAHLCLTCCRQLHMSLTSHMADQLLKATHAQVCSPPGEACCFLVRLEQERRCWLRRWPRNAEQRSTTYLPHWSSPSGGGTLRS